MRIFVKVAGVAAVLALLGAAPVHAQSCVWSCATNSENKHSIQEDENDDDKNNSGEKHGMVAPGNCGGSGQGEHDHVCLMEEEEQDAFAALSFDMEGGELLRFVTDAATRSPHSVMVSLARDQLVYVDCQGATWRVALSPAQMDVAMSSLDVGGDQWLASRVADEPLPQ